MAEDKESLQKCYSGAVQRCVDMFRQLGMEDWRSRAGRGSWNAKDYLGHLVTSQEREQDPATSLNLAGKPVDIPGLSERGAIHDFNQANLEDVRPLPVREVIQRFRTAFQEHLSMLEPLTDDDLAKPVQHPGLSGQPTLADLFTTGYAHLPVHYQDIRHCIRKRRSIPHWNDLSSPEETHELLGRVFALLPSMYWPERGGDLHATYLFTFPGEGGGQWTIEVAGDRCSSHPGSPERADIEIRVRPRDWLDIQTKVLNPMWALLTRRLRLRAKPTKLGLIARFEKLFEVS